MKVYIFYQTHKQDDEELDSIVNIYAVTDKKELAKKFRETRNMRLFKEVVHKCSKYEFAELMKKYGIFILLECKYKTQNHITGGVLYLDVVATRAEDEHVLIKGDRVFTELGRYTSDLFMLKDKYLNALDVLNYFNVYKAYGEDNMMNDYFYQGVPLINEKLFRGIDIDQYALFHKFSNNTLI